MGYLKLTAIATIATVALSACQGQNPLKQQSNPVPVKEYPHVVGAKVEPYVPGKQKVNPVDPDNSQYVCYEPFKVSVEPDHGSKLLTFTEDVAGKYTITVRSLLDNNFNIKAMLPKGASLTLLKGEEESNVKTYEFMWMPTKKRFSNDNDVQTLVLTFVSDLTNKKCGVVTDTLNLVVKKSAIAPTVSFLNMPQQQLAFGDSFKFQIQINDPASTANSAPILNAIQYRAIAQSAERARLDASAAVDCEAKGQYVSGTTWQFNCSYDSKLVKGVDAYLNKNANVDTTFFASAQSSRSQLASAASQANVRVAFTQVATTPSATDTTSTANATTDSTAAQTADTTTKTTKKTKSSKTKKGTKS